MSTEVTLRPNPSAFPRPDSLFLPDIASTGMTPSLLRSSSYSPFPIFPGANADPHGLDQFLLPPDDPSWQYTYPEPALHDRPSLKQRKSSGLKKVKSFSMIHRPSPLSQPPVSADQSGDPEIRQRKRSGSVDSLTPSRSDRDDTEDTEDAITFGNPSSLSIGRRSIRETLNLTRRSMLSAKDVSFPSIPSADSLDLVPPPVLPAATEEGGPSTPMSSRSSSNYSEVSSASSTSSSEGVKTPAEPTASQLDVEIAGSRLAVALAAAEGKRSKKGSWRGWLGGKRGQKVYSSILPDNASPPNASAESSPNTSTVSLTTVPHLTLTPSPSIASSPAPSIVEDIVNRGPQIDQMRRVSINKLSQLRAPSPHPLALALKRQYSNLPDEVAFSIQSGEKVFPFSVNSRDDNSGMKPMEGGLANTLGVKMVLSKLEKGECPAQTINPRRLSSLSIVQRPRGVLDFINRPPFEERNIVLYPNGTYSPISMARAGYGIWDIDFTPYIIALSEIDGRVSAPWPKLPRASIGSPIEGLEAVMSNVDTRVSPRLEETEEILVSPALIQAALSTEEVETPSTEQEPISSFRNARTNSMSLDYSSEDESDDEDQTSLAILAHKKSASALVPPKPAFGTHSRSMSSPGERPLRVVDDEANKRRHMDEVARARQRRMANLSGEVERRAEAERYRPQSQYPQSDSRRTSMSSFSNASSPGPGLHVSASSPPGHHQPRRRVQSTYDSLAPPPSRPDTVRHKSADSAASHSRRYHSFYGSPSMLSVPVHPQYSMHVPVMAPMYTHPAMSAFPAMASHQSHVFPHYSPAMLSPQHTGPAPLYLQMQGKSTRSSLVVPHSRSASRSRLS